MRFFMTYEENLMQTFDDTHKIGYEKIQKCGLRIKTDVAMHTFNAFKI